MNVEIKNNNGNLCFKITAIDESEKEILTFMVSDAEKNDKAIKMLSHCFSNSQVQNILIGWQPLKGINSGN